MIMNSACWPLAVCSVTHGAILRRAAASAGEFGRFTAREEATPPSTAATAATRSVAKRIRRSGRKEEVRFFSIEPVGLEVFPRQIKLNLVTASKNGASW